MHRLQGCRRALRCSATLHECHPLRSSSAFHPILQNATYGLSTPQCRLCLPPSLPRSFRTIPSQPLPFQDDTIYALSTSPGRAAIAIIRISGPAALQIYARVCANSPAPVPRVATLRRLLHPLEPSRPLDTGALVLYFPAPNTVTGEDVLELHVHGGNAIVRGVLDAIQLCNTKTSPPDGTASSEDIGTIRPAEPGEFTKRAFYNNRLDLTGVESLSDSLSAETTQQARLALSGTVSASSLTQRYEAWRTLLLHARGELEALIDFSEDQHFDESPAQLMSGTSKQVIELKRQIQGHILNASRGELLRSGINIALLGPPNAGKSSLLNRIVGREAAIVSAEEGTTRDIVDVGVDLHGWFVRLGDMAGVRAGQVPEQMREGTKGDVGPIEREGIRRARERALQSDLVVVLVSLQLTRDGRVDLALNTELLSAVGECRAAGKQMVFAVNKIDLLHAQTNSQRVSLSRLLDKVLEVFPGTDANDVFCLSCREADLPQPEEPDAGGLQTFLGGLTKKFSSMTSAALGATPGMTAAEAQSYWSASLSVTHRQSEYLKECLVHLDSFLELSGYEVEDASSTVTPDASSSGIEKDLYPPAPRYFDTTDTNRSSKQQYGIDNPQDLVANMDDIAPSNEAATTSTLRIPYSWAKNTAISDMEEIDIVTAAEHLRAAADCLAKLTGRGDGVTSGADVEDVLAVIFEKFCVGK